jgi:hypothetical protein
MMPERYDSDLSSRMSRLTLLTMCRLVCQAVTDQPLPSGSHTHAIWRPRASDIANGWKGLLADIADLADCARAQRHRGEVVRIGWLSDHIKYIAAGIRESVGAVHHHVYAAAGTGHLARCFAMKSTAHLRASSR